MEPNKNKAKKAKSTLSPIEKKKALKGVRAGGSGGGSNSRGTGNSNG